MSQPRSLGHPFNCAAGEALSLIDFKHLRMCSLAAHNRKVLQTEFRNFRRERTGRGWVRESRNNGASFKKSIRIYRFDRPRTEHNFWFGFVVCSSATVILSIVLSPFTVTCCAWMPIDKLSQSCRFAFRNPMVEAGLVRRPNAFEHLKRIFRFSVIPLRCGKRQDTIADKRGIHNTRLTRHNRCG